MSKKSVPIEYRSVDSDFLYRFHLPESLRQDAFDRYFCFNFPATFWRLMCETLEMMNFEIEIARSRMEFFMCLCYLLDNPKVCSKNYGKRGRRKKSEEYDEEEGETSELGDDERTFTIHTAQGEEQIPRFVVYMEYLQQEPETKSKERIRGAFAGYRVHVVILDPTLDLMQGFRNLVRINEKRSDIRTSSLIVDSFQRVKSIQDVHMMFQSFNSELYRNPEKYLNWNALNVYQIMSIAEAVNEQDILDVCLVQRSSENYENPDDKRLKFPYSNLVHEIPFYAINPKSIFSCLLPMNTSTESSLINTDERSRALMASSLRHKNMKSKVAMYQPPRIHECIAKDIETRKRLSGSPWNVMNQGPLIEQVVRNLSGCEFLHVRRKFEWFFKKRELKQLEFKNAFYDVFDAAPIDVIDPQLDALGNYVAWVFKVGDEKFTIKNTHKLLWMELTSSYSAHLMEPGLRLSLIIPGDAAKGKSFILDLLKRLLIDGSIEYFTDISNKVLNNESADFHSTVMAFHEALNRILGVGPDGRKDENEGDATIKTLMAEGRLRIIKSVQDEHTGEWKFNDVSKIMAVVVIMNTNAPEYNIPETIQSRSLIVPTVDVERDHHNVSSMTYAREIFGKDNDVEDVYRQFQKIDFLMFAAFQFVHVGLLPQPDITLCNAAYNILGAHIRSKFGIDVFGDGRALEMFKLICRVYTVLNAVLVEFCMRPATEVFDFKHLIRLAKHFVATEQVAVLAFSIIFSHRFFDKNLAAPFKYMLQDARCYKEEVSLDDDKPAYIEINQQVNAPRDDLPKPSLRETKVEAYTLKFGDSTCFHNVEAGVDYDYFAISTTGSANGSRDHEDIVADKMVQALRKRKIDMSRYKMKTYIRWLKKNAIDGKALAKFDPVLQKFCILRAWIEKTYTSDYQSLNTSCFEALHHQYTVAKKCVTMETLVHAPISMPHLVQTVELRPKPGHVLRDTVALQSNVLGLEYDGDLEALFRERFTKMTGLHTAPNSPVDPKRETTNYPHAQRDEYESAQIERNNILRHEGTKRIKKFTDVVRALSTKSDDDEVVVGGRHR